MKYLVIEGISHPRHALNDHTLGLNAKGLLFTGLSISQEKGFCTAREILEVSKEGHSTFYKRVRELVSKGYVTRHRWRNKGKIGGVFYRFYQVAGEGEEESDDK